MAYKIKNTKKDNLANANYYATTSEDKKIEKEMQKENLFGEESQEEKPSENKVYSMEEENSQIDQLIGNTDNFEEENGTEPEDDETFLEEGETWGIDKNNDHDPHADKTYKIGDRVRVRSDNDNENYNSFKEKTLKITDVDKDFDEEGGYLYSFEDEDGNEIGNSLYAWELESA